MLLANAELESHWLAATQFAKLLDELA